MTRTGDRILDVALQQFGTRGYEATSLDAIAAELGVRKQTILYWYPSKQALLDAVVGPQRRRASPDARRGARHAPATGSARIDAVMRGGVPLRGAPARAARAPARGRPPRIGARRRPRRARVQPLVERAVEFLERGDGRRHRPPRDPRLVLLFTYTAVVGVATDVEAQRVLGIEPSVASLARLRRELFAFLRAALCPDASTAAVGPARRQRYRDWRVWRSRARRTSSSMSSA